MSGAETSVLVAVALGMVAGLTIAALILALIFYFTFRV